MQIVNIRTSLMKHIDRKDYTKAEFEEIYRFYSRLEDYVVLINSEIV